MLLAPLRGSDGLLLLPAASAVGSTIYYARFAASEFTDS